MCKIKAKVDFVNVQNQGEKQEIETKVQNQRTHKIRTCTYDLRKMNYIAVLLLPLRKHMYVWADKHQFGGLQACLYNNCTYDLRNMNYIAGCQRTNIHLVGSEFVNVQNQGENQEIEQDCLIDMT